MKKALLCVLALIMVAGVYFVLNREDVSENIIDIPLTENTTTEWKEYQSPDKRIGFKYPSTWEIVAPKENWENASSIIIDPFPEDNDGSLMIRIFKGEKNGVSTVDRIRQERELTDDTFYSVSETHFDIHGNEAVKIEIRPKNAKETLTGSIYLDIDTGDYFVTVIASILFMEDDASRLYNTLLQEFLDGISVK